MLYVPYNIHYLVGENKRARWCFMCASCQSVPRFNIYRREDDAIDSFLSMFSFFLLVFEVTIVSLLLCTQSLMYSFNIHINKITAV